jgi:hypothetical protein
MITTLNHHLSRMPEGGFLSPMSIGALAICLGVDRGRLYAMEKSGKLRTVPTSAGRVIPSAECERLYMAMTVVRLPSGNTRMVFEEV